MICSICKRNTLKEFIRENLILCYVCKNIYDEVKNKNIKIKV